MSDSSTQRGSAAVPARPQGWTWHIRATLKIGAPLIAAQLTQQAIQVTDTVMLGWLSAEALAAGVLATTLFFVGFIAGTGFAYAVMPLASSAAGAGDVRGVRRVVRMGLWVGALVVSVLMVPLWFAGPILSLTGQDPELVVMAVQYLGIAQWSLYPAVAVMVLRSYLSALERTQVVMWATLAAAGLNVVLNWMLIFGNWGAPALGIRGAAIATLASQSLILALLIAYSLSRPALKKYELFVRFLRPDWDAFREVLRMGLPISATILAEVGMFSVSSLMMGRLGTIPLAAHGIALQVTSVIFMIPLSLASAGTVRVGHALGRHDVQGLDRGARTVMAMSLAVALAGALVLWLMPEPLIRAFLDDSEPQRAAIVATGTGLLAVAAVFQVVDTMQVISVGLLRGLSDTRIPMWMAVASYWGLGIPAAWLLAFPMGLGGIGVWIGLALGLAAAAVMLTWRFTQRDRLGLVRYPATSTA